MPNKFFIDDSDVLRLTETGELIGAVFDSIDNRRDILTTSDVQLAYAERIGALNAQIADLTEARNLLQKRVDAGVAAIKAAVLDPSVETETAVLAIIADATKSEREKKTEEINTQIRELQAKLADL